MYYVPKDRWEVIRQAYIGLFKLVSLDLFYKYYYYVNKNTIHISLTACW